MGKTIFICKLCREKYSSLDGLYSHLESEHGDAIPEDMCVEQFYYFLKTGKEHGKCVECGKPTLWNDKTKKYKRFCEDPECMEKYKETVRNRMIGKYGKVNLLNDPEQQRKMLMNRKISGLYDFNGVKIPYVGSYELDFLKTMDLFLDWDPNDIIMPSPHNYYYMYNGEKKFYIPDVFIPSLGLEIEIKDGGNNPNMHHKIQDVDKEKERLKDEVMSTQKIHHYIKITNKNYYNLFDFFDKMKEGLEKYGDYDKIPKIIITEDIKTKQVNPKSKSLLKKEANEVLKEGLEITEESYLFSKDDLYINFDKFESGESNICLITGLSGSGKSTLGKSLANKYNAIYVELDAFYMLNNGLESIHPIFKNFFKKHKNIYDQMSNFDLNNDSSISAYILNSIMEYCKSIKNKKFIIEGVQFFIYDIDDVKDLPLIIKNTSVIKSMSRMLKRDNVNEDGKFIYKDIFKIVPKYLKYYNYDEQNLNKFKNEVLKENYENVEESFNPDKALVWFDKPIDKLFNKNVTLYHGRDTKLKSKYLINDTISVGSTRFSKPRWATYYWDNIHYGIKWAIYTALNNNGYECIFNDPDEKQLWLLNDDMPNDKFINDICKKNIKCFVYEVKIEAKDLEVGPVPILKEYTVSKPVPYDKCHEIKITKSILNKYCEILTSEKLDFYETNMKEQKKRGPILNFILSDYRDTYRDDIFNDLQKKYKRVDNTIDISEYKKDVNDYDKKMKKKKIFNSNENYENVEENLLFSKDNMEFNLDKFNGDNNILYITGLCGSGKSTIIKKYAEKYNAEQLEFDAITSALTKGLDDLNKNKIHPIILEYLTTQNPIKLKNFSDPNFGNECVKFLDWFEKKVYGNGKLYILEGMQIFLCFDPKRFIGKPMVVMGTSVAKSMYRNVSRKYKRTGDIQKTFKHFIATLNRTNIIIKNDRQISELVDVISESFNPDKALVWLDKPIDKLFNKKIKLYHGSIEDIKGNKIDPISINVGATKFSNPRWSTYFWDDIESAKQWAMTWIVQRTTHSNVLYRGHEGKSIIGNNTKYNDEKFIQSILKGNPYIYIYETEIPISKLEMGSVPSIREYTVSESVPITKKHKIKVTKKMIQDYIEIKDDSIVRQMVDECPIDHMKNVRGFILNNILNNERDTYRLMIKNDIKNNKIKIGDDLSKYKNRINDAVKNDLYGLRESFNHYITLNINNNMNNGLYGFRDNVSSISFDNNHLKRVNHKLQQVEESCIDKENTTEIKIGYNGDIKPIINKNSNQGVFLLWNKKDSINNLLESISKEWFDSKLTIDDFHIIGGDNNVW